MQLFYKLLYKIAAVFYRLFKLFYNKGKAIERKFLPISEINKEKWQADNCEKTLRYNYNLTNNSIVLDVGGYEGDFVSEIYARYRCKIYVFEPVNKYITILANRFKLNTDVIIIDKGLGNANQELMINVMDEASSYKRSASIHKKGVEEKIQIIDIENFIKQHSILKIDLIKINIEGAEYDLLDRIIELNFLSNCTNLQIQFHDFYPDFNARYTKIKTQLLKTHQLTYSYPFVWENWELIKH